ncbi:zinc metallopeptidase [Riemerella anatipestifer]|uniref:Peptidase membrane zinc metallopeptidase n=1 Tax=Riemerella anatipestifer (strain ATCC 11845 / DSM 15868 / JCM 9532 / NCTC 11014) TaxID=693978 RepID=E4T9Z3_RIEAD|nr:zinc metallopeptidase [Riemerella anatipestifer]ADQ81890.1 peptidase membrane zinc metallopeptidase [Riemerella anatipestifer ATCC 11845 = DSM 15868]ADZ12608.1 Predicted Zn-dependent protease [Riemerella anatipestifer RA-GD]AFD55897.1 peptidase membrane zinc metallopeptidase [Riemerella anatipestifer ATCC 11845 = DSM 15868]AGC40196.1 putative Zn-dependent protease [Riemerella anatipestifer RA-CH-2]AKP69129.1 peptidase membrane zinc metallopeptidase [Riemerella anatipestifer]
MGYYIILGIITLVSWLVSARLKSKFNHYSKVILSNGLSGKEVAEKMLRDNGIHDVQVVSIPGQLTDHYNPINKTVNLSEAVYMQRNAAAAAVAAHECGHAVQHAVGYSMLQLRSKLVPIVNISSNLLQFILIGGIAVMAASGNKTLLAVGVGLFAITTLFAFVTLPVEYDASNRALKWLKSTGTVTTQEYAGAEDSLKWAARTYVVAALGSLAQLIYFASMLMERRD